MTKEELLKEALDCNYTNVQIKIRDAMMLGMDHETFQMIDKKPVVGWEITKATIEQLKLDGFNVEEFPDRFGLYSGGVKVSW